MGSTSLGSTNSIDKTRPMPGKKSGYGVYVLAVLLAIVATGLSAYAFQLWNAEREASEQLKSTQNTVASLQAEQRTAKETISTLESERDQGRADLQTASASVGDLEAKLAAREAELSALNEEHEKIGERLAEFKAFSAEFQRMIDSGTLNIRFRRGRMIVEMPAQVLFPSAGAELSEAGGATLQKVAEILRKFPDKHFIVAGHTDNIPIGGPGAAFQSNWELSTARALHVTEALIKFGLAPPQLTAAGAAEYDPIANNATPAGRQKNRRIEIILEPRLKELPSVDAKAEAAAPAAPMQAAPAAAAPTPAEPTPAAPAP
jgi:chemotaxis protein MotB